MYTNGTETLNHRQLQDRLNVSFPKSNPPQGWTEYVAPPAPEPTLDQIKQRLKSAIQQHLDETARERNYDSILSLATYTTSTDTTFAAEGQAGANWRDQVWKYWHQVLADVEAGTRTMPTETELLAELPAFTWPV